MAGSAPRRWVRGAIGRLERGLLTCQAALLYRWKGIEGVSRLISRAAPVNAGFLLVRYGASIGEGTAIQSPLHLQNMPSGDFSNLKVGRHCYIGKRVLFDLVEAIEVQNEVVLSANASIFTHADPGERPLREFYPRQTAMVTIGEGSWIGAGVIILHGVHIGRCCVVGAGAVVTADIPPYSLAVGVPARVVRTFRPGSQLSGAQ